VHGESREML